MQKYHWHMEKNIMDGDGMVSQDTVMTLLGQCHDDECTKHHSYVVPEWEMKKLKQEEEPMVIPVGKLIRVVHDM